MKTILLIDGQGGKLGKQIAESILASFDDVSLIAVGSNSIATATMIKGGVKLAATGENAVIVNARSADLIIGPIGIVIADSMLGEITPNMAMAVAQSPAVKILIPTNRCSNLIAGVGKQTVSDLIEDALWQMKSVLSPKE